MFTYDKILRSIFIPLLLSVRRSSHSVPATYSGFSMSTAARPPAILYCIARCSFEMIKRAPSSRGYEAHDMWCAIDPRNKNKVALQKSAKEGKAAFRFCSASVEECVWPPRLLSAIDGSVFASIHEHGSLVGPGGVRGGCSLFYKQPVENCWRRPMHCMGWCCCYCLLLVVCRVLWHVEESFPMLLYTNLGRKWGIFVILGSRRFSKSFFLCLPPSHVSKRLIPTLVYAPQL